MAALKEVRQRIKAVRGIGQVTKAMKMVSTVKMRRIQDKLLQARPYVDTLYDIATRLSGVKGPGGEAAHPLLEPGPAGAPEAVLIVGSDRGLCGSFNTALFRFVLAEIRPMTPKPVLFLAGRKTKEFFARQPFEVVKDFERLPFPAGWADAEHLSHVLLTAFHQLRLSRVRVAYQKFVSPGVSRPTLARWLPFEAPAGGDAGDVRCEPSVGEVLDSVLPNALKAQLQRALLESQASEQGARMVAMDNATTNASELARDLNLLANKLRQGGITKELLEISTGVEAMKN